MFEYFSPSILLLTLLFHPNMNHEGRLFEPVCQGTEKCNAKRPVINEMRSLCLRVPFQVKMNNLLGHL